MAWSELNWLRTGWNIGNLGWLRHTFGKNSQNSRRREEATETVSQTSTGSHTFMFATFLAWEWQLFLVYAMCLDLMVNFVFAPNCNWFTFVPRALRLQSRSCSDVHPCCLHWHGVSPWPRSGLCPVIRVYPRNPGEDSKGFVGNTYYPEEVSLIVKTEVLHACTMADDR
jgi:hypothetical protein